jgi:hypothetical protein
MSTTNMKTHVYHKLSAIGNLLWFLGCIRLHKDGDGIGLVFRWWNPISLLVLLLAIIPCAVFGEPLLEAVPFKLSKFWKDNMDQYQPVTPFTKLDSLRPFVFKRENYFK